MIALTQAPVADTPGAERYLALLHEVLVEVRAQVFENKPQLSALLRIAERVPDLLMENRDSHQEILAALEIYEQRYLHGHDRFSRILRHGFVDDWQLRWDW
ncbi:MAG: hypothetical protein HY301_04275 [Verrucomicrobia bacterium]|nr:hypothetical protein [Verrucomicrobiota bacterium]